MKSILLTSFLLLSTIFTAIGQSPTVIELFTSQGCSSCPPADKLIARLSEELKEDIIILSYHVDYWDYIGWKDPYASASNTNHQYEYGRTFNIRSVYTPQAVINGRNHVVGSNERELRGAVASETSRIDKSAVTIASVARVAEGVTIQASFKELPDDAIIMYALTVKEKTTIVNRGENRNKTLKNTHIVANFKKEQATYSQQEVALSIPSWVAKDDDITVVIYVSEPKNGIVASAAQNVK